MSDTNFAPVLPSAVRRQMDAVDAIARDAGIANAPPAPAVLDAPGNTTVVTEPTPPAPPHVPAADPGQATLPLDDWQQRYSTLKGKYDSEVPQLRTEVDSYKGRITSLEQILANLSNLPPAPAPAPVATPVAEPLPGETITPEDIANYGQDLISAAQRWADAKYSPVIRSLEQRILGVEGRTERVATRSASQSVELELDRAVNGWREINADPKFHIWLGQVDPFSGVKRQELITDAHVNGNAPRTIAFFQAYIREQTAVDPGQGTQQPQTPDLNDPGAGPLPLETLVAPGRGSHQAPAAPGAPAKRIWTQGEIAQFYSDKMRGAYRGRDAQALADEQDIIAAGREGRVRPR